MSSDILLASQQNPQIPVTSLFIRKELVGKGAYGGVYKGIHTPTGLVVALKVIDLDTPDDDISEIQKEVALLSEMRDAHKYHITLYHGCYLNGTELWIAMDFASGGSIRTLMKSGKIEEKYIVLIVREVLVALSFLHRQGIIHRDVKAANVLLTQAGKILLCDFGVAAHLQTNNKRSTFIGTPLWMAPEVITDGKLYDTKADIWSLGVTMYEIATGNPPYFGMEPLRACALIPRSTPAKLEGGTWSASMREFLGFCLQTDPTNRPMAEELSKTKWIKLGSKLPMAVLRELIVRYLSWIQTGGQRASLAGMESLAREDTFDIEEDIWDFSVDDAPPAVEPLGDEPPRSLDQQAALSSVRIPKVHHAPTISRNHPLLRLFDAASTPAPTYNNILSSFTQATAANGMDTIRPTISIPSFEEMDEMVESKTTKYTELPNDLIAPSTNSRGGPAPFAWAVPNQALGSPRMGSSSPKFRAQTPDSLWGSSSESQFSTPTEANFPDYISGSSGNNSYNSPFPVSTSPSLPSLSSDRPFALSRNRSNTAPNSEYPPLGPGIPTPLPSSDHSHSSGNSISSSNSLFSSISSSTSFSNATTPTGNNSPFLHSNSSTSSTVTNNSSPPPFRNHTPDQSKGYRTMSEVAQQGDANRPFRSRTGSDAVMPRLRNTSSGDSTLGMSVGSSGSGRARTGSDLRPSGLHPKHGMKLQISTSANPLPSGQPAAAFTQSYSTNTLSASTPPLSFNRHPTALDLAAAPFPSSSSTPTIATTHSNNSTPDYPFPSTASPRSIPIVWPEGPDLRPLDYGKLVTDSDVHEDLALTIGELGKWLQVVDFGLEKILHGTMV